MFQEKVKKYKYGKDREIMAKQTHTALIKKKVGKLKLNPQLYFRTIKQIET